MAKKKIIDGVQYSVCAIIFRNNHILMFERKGESYETGWEFIKGAMHFGETEEETVYREVAEESGVTARIIGKLPKVYDDEKPHQGGKLKIKARIFACEYLNGEVKLGEPEHTSYKWMSLEEAIEKVWLKNGGEMIREAYNLYSQKSDR